MSSSRQGLGSSVAVRSRRSSFTNTLISTAQTAAAAATAVGETLKNTKTALKNKSRIKTLKKHKSGNKRERSSSLLDLLPDEDPISRQHTFRRCISYNENEGIRRSYSSDTSSSEYTLADQNSILNIDSDSDSTDESESANFVREESNDSLCVQVRDEELEFDSSSSQHYKVKEQTTCIDLTANTETKTPRETTVSEGDLCLICMEPFSKKHPPIRIPCTKECNSTPVHAKCIYEWRECQAGKGVGSCPLCRSPLNRVTYLPPDIIRSARFTRFGPRRHFLVHPVPREAGVVRCYIRAVRSGLFSNISYELFLQAPTTLKYPLGPLPDRSGPREGDRLLAVARKRLTTWGCAQLDMSMNPSHCSDTQDVTSSYLGCVQSTFSGLEHSILAPHRCKNGKVVMCELGSVRYTQNRIRSTVGPRRVQVCLPSVRRVYEEVENNSSQTNYNPVVDNAPVIIPTPLPGQIWEQQGSAKVTTAGGEEEELFGEDNNMGDGDVSESEYDSDNEKDEAEMKQKAKARWATQVYNSSNGKETLANLLKLGSDNNSSSKVLFARNKEPYWLDAIQAYSLDFQGRVTLPSNKNFQLLMENSPDVDGNTATDKQYDIALQFGKVGDNQAVEMYTMDVQWPLSPVQAFGICLSACDRKLLCS
uniref:RING-type domain-containing protein n=1 Tax=Aplanochytrium stocchinoi TaxID=215587 RepID=A0A7S3PR58_9STRA|mmetsp:Transcript_30426/g.37612  ORF Transcript_30426/g.37612 Transcript_30426/m.37612 type:complete len:649 (+) Transcript_30426:436-2382(+)